MYASRGGAGVTGVDGARRLADAVLEATVVGSFSRIGFAARRALFDWDAEPVVDMSGRVVLVTGATGGLGLAAATALAQRNADSGSSAATRGASKQPGARSLPSHLIPA